jgi:hypothetical protein
MQKTISCLISMCAALAAANAMAADLSTKAPKDQSTATETKTDMFAIDSSLEANSRRSIFEYGSITVAPFGGLEKSGVRAKLESVNGGYYYNQQGDLDRGESPLVLIHGHFFGVSALVGYEYVGDKLSVAGYAGGDYQHDSLDRTDPTNPTTGTHWGAKFATEIDYRPDDTTAISLDGHYSTANNSWWSKFRPGFAVLPSMPSVYIGPEVGFQGDNFYRTWRVGAFAKGFKFGSLELGLSTGFLRNDVIGNGVYGAVEARVTF